MMVKIGRYEAVNSEHVVSMRLDTYGDTDLVVELVTGRTIRSKHTAYCMDGFDAYAAYETLLAAKAG